jgi:hypothetical protein
LKYCKDSLAPAGQHEHQFNTVYSVKSIRLNAYQNCTNLRELAAQEPFARICGELPAGVDFACSSDRAGLQGRQPMAIPAIPVILG